MNSKNKVHWHPINHYISNWRASNIIFQSLSAKIVSVKEITIEPIIVYVTMEKQNPGCTFWLEIKMNLSEIVHYHLFDSIIIYHNSHQENKWIFEYIPQESSNFKNTCHWRTIVIIHLITFDILTAKVHASSLTLVKLR